MKRTALLVLSLLFLLPATAASAFDVGDAVTITRSGDTYNGSRAEVIHKFATGRGLVVIDGTNQSPILRRYTSAQLVVAQATPTPTPSPSPSPSPSPTPTATPTPTPTNTPTPSPTPDPTPVPTGSNCMPDPSACGFPDVENTGVNPLISRTTVNGSVTLSTAGMVYQDKTVNGSITVQANNVTIRNVKVNGGQVFIHWGSTYTGLLVENTEIDMGGNLDSRGIEYGNYTARRVFIHNGSDCAQLDFNVTITDSLCVNGPDANDDGWPDNTSFCNDPRELHYDGFESDGGSGYVLDHNTIRNACDQTSAILMSTNVAAISTVQISRNLVTGGGYSIYCAANGKKVGGTNSFTGNRFARTWYPNSGYWGPTTDCAAGTGYQTISGNVWDDTGAPVP